MDSRLKQFYHQTSDEGPHDNYHVVIPLHESPTLSWNEIFQKAPVLPKGWYELARLPSKDRVEFSHDFWMSKLPYGVQTNKLLERFFASLEDVAILVTQKKFDDPFEANLVYCLKGSDSFFRGNPPIDAEGLQEIEDLFCLISPQTITSPFYASTTDLLKPQTAPVLRARGRCVKNI